MKRSLAILAVASLAVMVFGQSRQEQADMKSIEKLIQKEITAFLDKDWDKYQECWLHEPYTRHFVSSKSSFNGMIGWEHIQQIMSQGFSSEGPRGFTFEKTDLDIHVFGDAAYATIRERYGSTSGDDPWSIDALNNAFLVRHEGSWKFVCMNFVNTSSYDDAREHRALIQGFLETISGNAKTRQVFEKYIHKGNESLIRQNLAVEQAFPMYELIPEEIMVDGNRVMVRARFRGVQHGTYGTIPPSGKEVSLDVILLYTLANGKITEHTVTYDNESMLKQLGALSP
jgi:predicted ester cyclase